MLDDVHTGWDSFLHWAELFRSRQDFDAEERNYKLESARSLASARTTLHAGGDWLSDLKRAFSQSNVVSHWTFMPFRDWSLADPTTAEAALRALWREGATLGERLEGFDRLVPEAEVNGPGVRCNRATFLLGAVDPLCYPVFKSTPFDLAYALTRTAPPAGDVTMVQRYETALALLDELQERALSRGVPCRDRLDAQGVLWCVTQWEAPADWTAEAKLEFETWRASPRRKKTTATKGSSRSAPVKRPARPPVCPLCATDEEVRRVGPVDNGRWAYTCEAGPGHAEPYAFDATT